VVSITFGSVRFLLHLSRQATDPFRAYKQLIGRSLLLSLEFLVAADVIHTVFLDLTAKGLGTLAALVAIRAGLWWSRSMAVGRGARRRSRPRVNQAEGPRSGRDDRPFPWARLSIFEMARGISGDR